MSLLSFDLAGERFAIDFGSVRAVVPMSAPCRLPETPSFLLGLVASPVGPVPLVDFARKFRLVESAGSEAATVVVVEAIVDGLPTLMGISVGDHCQVVEVASDAIEPPPPLGAGLRVEYLRGVVSVDGGLLALIDLGRTLTATEREAIEGLQRELSTGDPMVVPDSPGVAGTASQVRPRLDEKEYLVFSVSGEKIALPLAQLREVTQYRPSTPVPGAPASIRGAVNVRGTVVPLLDMARLLRLTSTAPTPRSFCLIVEVSLVSGCVPVALAADDIIDVITDGPGGLAAAVSLGLRIPPDYVCTIIHSADDYVPVLDAPALLSGARLGHS